MIVMPLLSVDLLNHDPEELKLDENRLHEAQLTHGSSHVRLPIRTRTKPLLRFAR
jgi:hypothetical protein